MKIAVTGASGFIGRYVLKELEIEKIETIAITRKAENITDIYSTCKIVEMDITKPHKEDYEILQKPDVLIHLAWDGLPNYRSMHHFETELPNQYKFLKNLVQLGLPAIIITGTCFEYGMQSGMLHEEYLPLPDNPYGYAKNALRHQLEFLRNTESYTMTWARLFYMYGEGQHESSLYPQLKSAVERGDKEFNMSGGEQLRDYLPIKSVARLLIALALRNGYNGIVNVCSGKPISVRNLVEGWIRENNWKIDLNLGHYPYPDYEPMAFWGSRERLDMLLEKK